MMNLITLYPQSEVKAISKGKNGLTATVSRCEMPPSFKKKYNTISRNGQQYIVLDISITTNSDGMFMEMQNHVNRCGSFSGVIN